MKIKILIIAFIFCPYIYAQKDTVLYYSKSGINVSSKQEADYYHELKIQNNNKMQLNTYIKEEDDWKINSKTTITKLNDTSFLMKSDQDIVRVFHKVDSGYLIKDFLDSGLNSTGFSKMIFPLIRSGYWVDYSWDGSIDSEDYYVNGNLKFYKYYIDKNHFIQDSSYFQDTPAEYIGGIMALMQFVQSNINYPEYAKIKNIQGRAIIKFIVSPEGNVIGAKPINKVNELLADEAIRVLKLTSGHWIPAKSGNRNVNCFFVIPVKFGLR